MSFPLSFKGTLSYNLSQSGIIAGKSGTPPTPPGNDGSQLKSIPTDLNINWKGNIPKSIYNLAQTIDDIENNFNSYKLEVNYIFTTSSGNQYCDSDGASILLYNGADYSKIGELRAVYDDAAGDCKYNSSTSSFKLLYPDQSLITSLWTFSYTLDKGEDNTQINDLTLDLVIELTLTLQCELGSKDLQTEVCYDYCSTNLQDKICYQNYSEYCFSDTFIPGFFGPSGSTGPTGAAGSTGPVIFENGGNNPCNTYFQGYLGNQGPGPNNQLDNLLSNACSFITDLDEFNNQTGGQNGIQNICACHIDPTFYQNIENSINSLPGGQVVDVPSPCLFPPCVNSPYKLNITGKACPTIPCISLTDITNNGTIQGGIKINQSCLQSSSTTITKYLIFIVPAIFIILIVIAVFLFLFFKNK